MTKTRALTKKLRTSIIDFLKENPKKKIIISNIFGDEEGKKFAEKIIKFIEKEGFKIGEREEVIYEEPIYGIAFTTDKKSAEILVCERKNK